MDPELINTLLNITFLVVIGFLVLISLMTAYVFIRYGKNKVFTTITSLAFGAVFLLGTLAAFLTLQNIF